MMMETYNKDAIALWEERYRYVVKAAILFRGSYDLEIDDLVQEAAVDFFTLAQQHDREELIRRFPFMLKGAFLRHVRGLKGIPRPKNVQVDISTVSMSIIGHDVPDIIPGKDKELNRLHLEFLDSLTQEEERIVDLRLDRLKYKQIEKIMGYSSRHVLYRRMVQIRQKYCKIMKLWIEQQEEGYEQSYRSLCKKAHDPVQDKRR